MDGYVFIFILDYTHTLRYIYTKSIVGEHTENSWSDNPEKLII